MLRRGFFAYHRKLDNMGYKQYTSLYWIGSYLIILAAIGVQLIWLPAPYMNESGKQWIEYIDQIYYFVMVIPLCWLMGSTCRLLLIRQWHAGYKVIQAIITICSVFLLLMLLQKNNDYFVMVVLSIVIMISIMIDIIISARADRREKQLKKQHVYPRQLQGLILYIGCLVLVLCPTAYNVTYPGLTMNMNRYAHIGNHTAQGKIDGVLVFERPAFPIDFLYERIFPAYELHRRPPGEPSIAETYSQVVTMKEDTNKLAAAVALQAAGVGRSISYDGVAVLGIVQHSPADGLLQAGDVITEINEVKMEMLADLLQYMQEHVIAGDTIRIKVMRESNEQELEITTGAANDGSNRAVMGISIRTAYSVHVDENLHFQSYMAHVGGPSHGAMLTLSFLDQLTEGDMTNGLYVAGTGTIEVDGTIGMVGGITQKAYAVSRTAADVFFVPAAGAEIAKLSAPELNVVAVSTFEDIIQWLKEKGEHSQL